MRVCVPAWFTYQSACVACQKPVNLPVLRANKRENVPNGVPKFQIGVPTCQAACESFNFACQQEVIKEISIF